MENIPGIVTLIIAIIFTCINLGILHKYVFRIYFSGSDIFKEIFWAFMIACVETGLIINLFVGAVTGIVSIVAAVAKFIFRLMLILAAIVAIGFVLSKVLPVIMPKTRPVIMKLLLFINEKIHIFNIRPTKNEDQNTDEDHENSNAENDVNADSATMNFCSKCGEQLLDGALFCQKCGTKADSK